MNKNVLIVEHNSNPLSYLKESASVKTRDKYTLGGKFTEFDIKNRNDRVYTWGKFQPALDELNERIESMGVYGEFDHPDTFDTSLKNASHLIKEARYDSSSNAVVGKIKLLTTNWGKQARSLVDDECPLFVSSRAAGITEANGEVTLKKLFTYDIVADPGFSSARMQSLNESMGYSNKANFRIYEIEDESKINQLFEMNKDDMVTKKQLTEYSQYLVGQLTSTKKKVNEAIKTGNMDSKKLDELLEYYENTQGDFKNITKYLDYLAENLETVIIENKSLKKSNQELKETTGRLIEHNDYLAENLEKSIEYSEYLAENVDKSIQYGEYIAEQLDKSIDYSNYIAENLDRSIGFSDYLAENLNKSIEYSEYIAENVDTNIAYSEYIAENLDDGLAYTDYIAEQLDNAIGYTKMISEKLNSSKMITESFDEDEDGFPMPGDAGIEEIDELEDEMDNQIGDDLVSDIESDNELDGLEEDPNCRVVCDDDEEEGEEGVESDDDEDIQNTPEMEGDIIPSEEEEEEEDLDQVLEESAETDECKDCDEEEEKEEESLSKSIDKLIEEAKKRKAFETTDHHFMKFLNKDQVDSFYSLTQEDQEMVVSHINEKSNYYSTNDVLKLINESLKSKEESLDSRLVRLMPSEVKETWEKISESAKKSILSQSKLHPSTKWNEDTIEHFWLTRRFPAVNEKRELIEKEDKLIQEDVLSDEAMNSILERFNRV